MQEAWIRAARGAYGGDRRGHRGSPRNGLRVAVPFRHRLRCCSTDPRPKDVSASAVWFSG